MWCEDNLRACDKSVQKCCDSSSIGGCCNRNDEGCIWYVIKVRLSHCPCFYYCSRHSNGSFKGCMQLQYGEVANTLRSAA